MRIYKTLMNKTFIYLLITVLAACKSTPYSDETTKSDLRAPAYPLLTLHPHMKLWSMTDELNKQNMTFGGSTTSFCWLLAGRRCYVSFYG